MLSSVQAGPFQRDSVAAAGAVQAAVGGAKAFVQQVMGLPDTVRVNVSFFSKNLQVQQPFTDDQTPPR